MSKSVFLDGYQVGRRIADQCSVLIRKTKSSEDMGRLAGKLLLEVVLAKDALQKYEYSFSDNWRMGFFDGFSDRAEAIKKS